MSNAPTVFTPTVTDYVQKNVNPATGAATPGVTYGAPTAAAPYGTYTATPASTPVTTPSKTVTSVTTPPPAGTITSTSTPVVNQENTTAQTVDGLTNPTPNNDTSGLSAAYQKVQDSIQAQRDNLNAQLTGQEASINSQFDAEKAADIKAQTSETATTNVALQRVGGYLGTQISAVGALNNLTATHQAEIATLEAKRAQALQEARDAKNSKDMELAQQLADSVKGYDQEINSRRNTYFDQVTSLNNQIRQQQQAQTAAQTAQANQQNQLRDDARSSLSTIINSFGGIDVSSLDPASKSYIQQLADTAGIPLDTIQGPTLAQKSQQNTQHQQQISNAIAQAHLALSQKSFNLSNTLSPGEVKTAGLPVSLIGKSEQQVAQDFQSKVPPDWFMEYQANQAESEPGKPAVDISSAFHFSHCRQNVF